MMKKRIVKDALMNLFKILLAGALIYWLIEKDYFNLEDLKKIINLKTTLISLLMVFLSYVFLSLRWQVLLAAQKVYVGFFPVFKLNLIGVFFNHLITGQLSGDIVKVYYLIKEHKEKKIEIISTTIVDRVVGLYVMIFLGVLGIALDISDVSTNPQLLIVSKTLLMVFFMSTLFFYVIFSNRIQGLNWFQKLLSKNKKILNLSDVLRKYFEDKIVFLKVLVLTSLAQVSSISILYLFGLELGYSEMSVSAYFFLCSVGFILSALPISPAGIGVGQAAFFMLFNLYLGEKSNLGPTIITGLQFFNAIFAILGAILYLTHRRSRAAVL